ncbi:glycosyltransferase family 4 protein [Aquabacterium sp. J223]|uniref:glycosyltransferase family 4 protein n=1 Tax=Aquabacterium sp. J223 TaxID=2898431 RepID=UPI0021AE1936|nr:glycosyltransferase family 4 protein [Aquabacterium sp. J223]UUX94181.1 glycosyltransferase family 4 protein [Aquabacterium sp. J223]
MPRRPLRILTWHVHGNYLYYLSQVPHEFWLVTDAQRSSHHSGRSGRLPWGDNVKEAPVEALAQMDFDVVLYQSRHAWETERHTLLSPAQRRLPAIVLEHDPPQEHPTNTRHWAADAPDTLIVHCTHFNALMWDSGASSVQVVEHGVRPLADARYRGERAEGVVVVNNLARRGRRLGADVYATVREQVPLVLVGMNAEAAGGLGEVAHQDLPGFVAERRFFFNPIRYTSLGLSIVEAMMVGAPIVGLATTELATVLRDGETGFVDTRLDRLVDSMRRLLADPGLARSVGEAGRRLAQERFGIGRFVTDWQRVLQTVAG